MGKVHTTEGLLKPPSSQLMSEPEIIAGIAEATLGDRGGVDGLAFGKDYDLIRSEIAQVVKGFEELKALDKGGSFYLPNPARRGDFSALPYQKAQFSICKLPGHQLEKDDFLLMTIRSHDQFNTTVYGLDDRYRGVKNERRVVFMNPEDMKKHQLQRLDLIDLCSFYEGQERRAEQFYVIPYDIPPQNLACYFPESNASIPLRQFADRNHTLISKSVKVKVIPSAS